MMLLLLSIIIFIETMIWSIVSVLLAVAQSTVLTKTPKEEISTRSPIMSRINGSMVQSAPFPAGSFVLEKPIGRVGPVARVVNNYNSANLPCCRDRFGEQACQALSKGQPDVFERRCLADHDFHTMDCCVECRRYIESHKIHPENARSLFKAPTVCKDKHSLQFCRRFKSVGMGKFSCGDAEFAVRVCRHSCGYCNDGLYAAGNAAPFCNATTTQNNRRLQ